MNLEDKYQCAFVKAFRIQFPDILMWHTPNGGMRNIAEAAKFKRMGVLPGIPDVFIAEPRRGKHGMFIELKTEKGAVSEYQKKILPKLEGVGYAVAVCIGWEAALTAAKAYLME